MKKALLLLSALSILCASGFAEVKDAVTFLPERAVRMSGLLQDRFEANLHGRLLSMSEDDMLNGFRKRPGSHPWIGEHVGKWLQAASYAWLNSGNDALRAKLDRVASELMNTQEPDGYLGTYAPGRRMGRFDQDQ